MCFGKILPVVTTTGDKGNHGQLQLKRLPKNHLWAARPVAGEFATAHTYVMWIVDSFTYEHGKGDLQHALEETIVQKQSEVQIIQPHDYALQLQL